MANGPGCSYTTGTQLGDAVAFLRAHPHQVAFVTVDIGAGDVAACQIVLGVNTDLRLGGHQPDLQRTPPGVGPAQGGRPRGPHLRDELLRPVPGHLADRIRQGSRSPPRASTSTDQLNALLEPDLHGGRSIDGRSVLASSKRTTPIPTGTYAGTTVPQDVALVCQWTGACTSPGSIQPNDQGYAQLAAAFEQVIDGVSIDTMGLPPGVGQDGLLGRADGHGRIRPV